MLLVIDSGNTNAVFAVYEGEEQRGQWRIHTNSERTADEYAVWLSGLFTLAGISMKDITGVMISNVVPPAGRAFSLLAKRYFKQEAVTVEMGLKHYDMAIRLERPEQVGADRLANAISAHRDYGGALIIVDFGTATTFDLVDPDGAYSGGIIAPGINLSMEALYTAAAKLPRITVEKPDQVVGYDTISAMRSGVFWGYIGLIEGLIRRIKQEQGGHHTVVATGGLASLFHETSSAIDHVDGDLTLRGLVYLHKVYQSRN